MTIDFSHSKYNIDLCTKQEIIVSGMILIAMDAEQVWLATCVKKDSVALSGVQWTMEAVKVEIPWLPPATLFN